MSIAQEPSASAKYEAFLDARLNQARQQVRWLDIAVGAVGLIALTLGYGLIMLVLDRELHLPTFVRQISLAGFVAFAVWYVMRVLLTPLRTAVNPYYAAKKVEHVLPQSKNSLMSWLDLRDRPLAEPIRDAIGRKAATDLSHANVTEAVRDTRLVRSGAILTVLALAALITLLALRPPQFFSLLQRAFLPFNSTAIATRTVIKLIKPEGGDATLSVNQSLHVLVEVDGRNPKADAQDAMRLRMRYQASDPWEERKLDATDRPGEWRIQIPAASVRTGFEYQVVGGDAETAIYRVRVRAKAMITDFEVTYKYRPYLGFADDVRADPNLSAYRGTTVTLLAKTNRPVKDGTLKFVPSAGGINPPLASIPMADRPDTLKFVMQLDQSGKYRLQFSSADGEPSEETLPFDINVLPDLPPRVEVTKPATSPVAANGFLFVNGKASDDFGLTAARMIFRMRSAAGVAPEVLQPMAMRDRQSLTQPDGKILRQVELKDAIPIESLKDAIGTKVSWAPGMMLEYAFEAEDNFDYPSPQVGRSPWESVTIGNPASQEEKNKSQAAADQVKKEQEQQQQDQQNGKQDNKGQGDNKQQDQQQGGQQDNKGQENKGQDKKGQDNKGQGDQQQPKDQNDQQDSKSEDQKGQGNQQQPKDQPEDGNEGQGKGDKSEQNKPNQKQANDAGKGEQQGDQQQKGQQPLTPEEKKTLEAAKKLEDALREEQKNNSPSEKREGGDQPNDPNAQRKPDGEKDKQQPKDSKQDKQDNKNGKAGDQNDKPEQDKGDKQDSKGQGQERKDGDKTDKEGKKPGQGDSNKSNEQDPKTSPDQGKEDGGKGRSERGGENKAGDKADKPDQKGQSGEADPKAKPKDEGKPDGAKSKGGKPGDEKGKTEPDSGRKDARPDNTKPDQPGNKEPTPDHMKGQGEKSEGKDEGKSGQPSKPGEKQGKEGKADSNSKQAGSEEAKTGDQNRNAEAKQGQSEADRLQDIAKNGKTQEERDAAKEKLDKLLEEINKQGGEKNPSDRKTNPEGKVKDKSDQGKGEKPGNKPGEDHVGEGQAKQNPHEDAKENVNPDNLPKNTKNPNDKKSSGTPPKLGDQPQTPTQPGSGQPGGDTRGDVNSSGGEGLGKANEGFSRQAGELQLDDFRNKVDRKVLDRAKMSDQEYQDFLKAYEKLVQKHKEMGPQPGDRVRGDAKGSSAANSGAKKVDAQAGGPKVDRTGRGQAPADIRDQYRDFTEQQSKQK